MSFKNLDKVGIGTNTDGSVQFVQKVQNPKQEKFDNVSVGKVSTYLDKLKTEQASQQKTSVENIQQIQTIEKSGRRQVLSSATGVGTLLGGTVTTSSILPSTIYLGTLEGILGKDDWKTKHKIYRDIYTYDLAGAVVDIISTLPYSDFNLIGISDDKVLRTYMDTLEDLRLPQMLPSITTDYLVMGTFIGSLGWKTDKNKFTVMIPQDLDYCDISDLGIAGVDPIIDVTLSEHYQDILSKTGPRFDRLKKQLPDYIVNGARANGKIELDPFYTLYVARRGLSCPFSNSDQEAIETAGSGNSYFNRILTIHLLEKALIKGTIESAQRRQRAITHIKAGNENWIPTDDELAQLSELFLSADLDPISAQVATRDGVEVNSVKAGDDFWKWNDIFDFTAGAKMKALGVNESILSGDASFNTLDAAISSFMENISQTRELITQQVFYNKLCPIIAYHNDFKRKKEDKTQILSSLIKNQKGRVGKSKVLAAGNIPEIDDLSDYLIPTIEYTKNLKPEVDKDYLEILETLEEKGIPIPLRVYAAAGGENIDELINALEDDNELRLEIAERKKELIESSVQEKTEKFLGIDNIEELLPQQEELEAKLKTFASLGNIDRSAKNRNLQALNEEAFAPREYDASGHRRILTANQKKNITNKIHHRIADVMVKKAEEENFKIKNGIK